MPDRMFTRSELEEMGIPDRAVPYGASTPRGIANFHVLKEEDSNEGSTNYRMIFQAPDDYNKYELVFQRSNTNTPVDPFFGSDTVLARHVYLHLRIVTESVPWENRNEVPPIVSHEALVDFLEKVLPDGPDIDERCEAAARKYSEDMDRGIYEDWEAKNNPYL
ncbi:hypothetical protein [Rhodococcus qingshengii]|uniref:hypothetical protein n=1 Tax=Rhodococcus qingshengii TaxID=334542 RepID=UPI0035E2A9E2